MAARLKGRFIKHGERKRRAVLQNTCEARKSEEKQDDADNMNSKKDEKLDGNRIVNLNEIIRQLRKGCSDCGEELRLTRIMSETKSGLGSHFYLVCNLIYSGNTHYDQEKQQRRKIFNINTKTATGKTL